MEVLTKIIGIVSNEELIQAALSIIGGFAVLATLTANKTDNKILNILLKLINLLGANFGKAANKDVK